MASYLDSVPFSGIIRIRDMMYSVADPYRLDQGDVSFDAPDTVKSAMTRAIAENKSHYLQTTGVPRLRELIAAKLRSKNTIPVDDPEDVLVTNGGIHGLHIICRALLEPGDEVLIPDPEWPPAAGNILAARGVPVGCRLYEANGWRYDLDEVESKITPRTRVLYVNSPSNPTGGVLTRGDVERLAAIAREHNLWVISDEAYEDVIFDGEHVSIASLPGMYERTIPLYTFSKSYAMTGPRLGYVAIKDQKIRGPRQEDPLLHREQHRLGRPVRRHRRARGTAGLHRRVSHRAARAARPVLQGPQRAGRRCLLREAAGGRLLRVRAHRPGLGQ